MSPIVYRPIMNHFIPPFVLAVSLPGAALADTELKREYSAKDLGRIQGLGAAHFQQTATIEDDQLEPIATITTEKGFFSRGKFTDRVRSDNFFRAFIDKSSGQVRYQLYAEVSYNFEWRTFTSASVLSGGRPTSLPLTPIARNVVTCASSICSYKEIVALPLTEEMVREIAATGESAPGRLWPYRLKAQNGLDFEDAAIPAEAAGLLLAVAAYRRRMNLVPAISSQ